MATDPVVQAFKDNDTRFEELFRAALSESRAWERFSTPDSEGNTLFKYATDRVEAIEFDLDKINIVQNNKGRWEAAQNIFNKERKPFINVILRLLIAGAMPTDEESLSLEDFNLLDDFNLNEIIHNTPMGTTIFIDTYNTNKPEFEELLQHTLKGKTEKNLKLLLLAAENVKRESLYSLAAEAKDYDLLNKLIGLKVPGAIDKVMEPLQVIRVLHEIEPGIYGGLRTYEQVTQAYISKIKEGLQINTDIKSKDINNYLRFTAINDSPAAKNLLVPHVTPRLDIWMEEQTNYLKSSRRIYDVVEAYTYHGDRLVNSYIRRTFTSPLTLMESIQSDIKFPLAYQVLDSYDILLRKGMMGPPIKDMYLTTGEVNHAAVMKLFNDNFTFFNLLNILYPLVNAYRKELSKIIKQSPQLGYDMVVFRGVREEAHHAPGTIRYVTDSFISTSLNPRIARNFSNEPIYGTSFGKFIYEITIPAEIPCLYIEGITFITGEAEVLLPHNLKIHAKYETTLKQYSFHIEAPSIDTFVGDLSGAERHLVRTMSIVGYAPFQEPNVVATAKKNTTRKTIKNMTGKSKRALLKYNRNNNYTRRT